MIKGLTIFFVALFAILQWRLWVGEGSIAHWLSLQSTIVDQKEINTRLKAKNEQLAAEVYAFKHDVRAVEALAREGMGMIQEGETFFMIVNPKGTENNK